jgi:two-component system sensor histidine kinase YesM
MAVDKDQFEISQMISSLAKITRYSINNSNKTVPIQDEIEWLHQYIRLQQIRYKNSFEYSIKSDMHILNYNIHKLMMQPFVENAILHGFSGGERKYFLNITIRDKGAYILISIHDNGCGIAPGILNDISVRQSDDSDHIGVANAIGRIRNYYDNNADVIIDSKQGFGTTVMIRLANSKGESG